MTGSDELEHILARHGRTFDRFQHIDVHRKFLLRKRMLRWAVAGPAYCPFIGDGDLAARLYTDRLILGADLEEKRVQAARDQLEPITDPHHPPHIVVADCNTWPFAHYRGRPIAVADFDPYGNPFDSFKAFWTEAPRAQRLVVFMTDGLRLDLIRKSRLHHPDGRVINLSRFATSEAYHHYLSNHIWPWFEGYVAPTRVLARMRYTRGNMVYWGACLDGPKRRRRATQRK